MPMIRVNDIDINYLLEGDGPETVVLINGLADDLLSWVYQSDALLVAGFRVLRFDNRGIGESSKPAGPYTTALFAADAGSTRARRLPDRHRAVRRSIGTVCNCRKSTIIS